MSDTQIEQSNILISGKWVASAGAESTDVKDPTRLQLIGRIATCDAIEVGQAIDAALASASDWARVPVAEKRRLLVAISGRIRVQAQSLAECLTRESGKALIESYESVLAVAERFEQPDAVSPHRARGVLSSTVTVVLTPHTAPLLMMAHFVVPALMRGSSVVVKPPDQCPLSTIQLVQLMEDLPRGVVNLVTGGMNTGRCLIAHPHVTTVAFAGSDGVGKALEATVTAAGKSFWGELGSIDGVMVCADSPLDQVIPTLIWSRLQNAGRSCVAAKRIYVERAVADEVMQRTHLYLADLEFGDPLLTSTDVGPLGSLAAIRRVEDQVAYSMKAGARLVVGGMRFRPAGLPGFFFQPTILADAPDSVKVMREEVLGPVFAMQTVDSVDSAMASLSAAGLGRRIGVFTQDTERVRRLSMGAPDWALWVNQPFTEAELFGVTPRRVSTTVPECGLPSAGFPYKKRPMPDRRAT